MRIFPHPPRGPLRHFLSPPFSRGVDYAVVLFARPRERASDPFEVAKSGAVAVYALLAWLPDSFAGQGRLGTFVSPRVFSTSMLCCVAASGLRAYSSFGVLAGAAPAAGAGSADCATAASIDPMMTTALSMLTREREKEKGPLFHNPPHPLPHFGFVVSSSL